MLAILLTLTATFAAEIAQSLGKDSVRHRRETVYDLGFLALFWGLIFFVVSAAFGADLHFSLASLPTLIPRIGLEILLVYINCEAIVKANRTTLGFIRLLTIPLLLVIDIALGYHLTPLQIGGIGLMFGALILAFRHNPAGHRGAWLATISAILAAATVALYKYDITHYNSVAAEQSIALGTILIIFFIVASRHRRRSPLTLLWQPVTGTQSISHGIALVLTSFAMNFAPASIVLTFHRSFALMWAIVFGGTYFHEHSLGRKTVSALLMVVSIVLIASPALIHA